MAHQTVHAGFGVGPQRGLSQPGRLAWSLVIGAVVAAALITVSLGQAPTVTGEDWHGNVASSGWSAR